MTAFLADGDPPSDRTTVMLTPHTEGHTSGRFADQSRVDETLVPTETLHGTQPAVEVSVAADFLAPIDHRSTTIHTHHEHHPPRTSPVVLSFAVDPDFLTSFNAFYDDFIQSPTYARAHSADNRSPIVDDDNDDDDDDDTLTNTDAAMTSTHRLRLVLRDLAEVNQQLFTLLQKLPPPPDVNVPSPAPTVQPPFLCADTTQQPTLCPEQLGKHTPQYVLMQAPPPAPDPVAISLQKPTHPIDALSCIAHGKPPHAPIPETNSEHRRPTRHSPTTLKSIPNWAKPAVPSPAIPMEGVVSPPWPPPRPNLKTTPHKKKSPAKHTVTQRSRDKDFLRPP